MQDSINILFQASNHITVSSRLKSSPIKIAKPQNYFPETINYSPLPISFPTEARNFFGPLLSRPHSACGISCAPSSRCCSVIIAGTPIPLLPGPHNHSASKRERGEGGKGGRRRLSNGRPRGISRLLGAPPPPRHHPNEFSRGVRPIDSPIRNARASRNLDEERRREGRARGRGREGLSRTHYYRGLRQSRPRYFERERGTRGA